MARNKKLELNSVSSGVWFTTDGRFAVVRQRKPINPMLVTNDFKIANEFSIRSFEGYDGPKEYPQLAPEIGKVDVFKEVFPWLGEFTGEGSFVVGDPVHSKPLPLGGRRVQEDFDVRGELLGEGVQIDRKWVTGVKKWWKQWVKKADAISKLRGEKSYGRVLAYLEEGEKRLWRIKDDFDYNKGGLPFDAFLEKDRKQNIKQMKGFDPRVDIAYMFKDAFAKLKDIRDSIEHWHEAVFMVGAHAYIMRGPLVRDTSDGKLHAYDAEVSSMPWLVGELDKIVSGKLFRRLNKFVSSVEKMGIPAEFDAGESELSVGRAKLVMDVNRQDQISSYGTGDFSVHPSEMKRYVRVMEKARTLLVKAGFGKAWYGNFFIRSKKRAREWTGELTGKKHSEGAHYHIAMDNVVLFNWYGGTGVERSIVHELGHRWYYKFMSQQQRAQFDSYFGEVPAVRSYGKENPAEDFATVFEYYVLGKKLTRDQRERFKQFALMGGKIRRQEDEYADGDLLVEAAWKVNRQWISAAQKWWRQILNKSKRFQGMSGERALKDAIKYVEDVLDQIDKFKNDLWLDKGMFPFDMTGKEWKDRRNEASSYDANKIAWDLEHAWKEVDQVLSRLLHFYDANYDTRSMAYRGHPDMRKPSQNGKNAADASLDNLYGEMLEVDKFISGKVLKRLSSIVKKYSDEHPEPVEAPFDPVKNEFMIGKVKVFIDYGSGWHGRLPSPAHMAGGEEAIVSPEDTDYYVREINAARKLVTKAGFGRAWYGMIMIQPANRGRSFVSQSSGKQHRAVGSWAWSDQVNVYGSWIDVRRTIAHEVGHRWYYKFMNQQQRAQFDSYFGEVPAVRSYGKENPAEDFATVFEYYVLGEKLTRDQRERFKEFALMGGKIRRQESVDIDSLRRMRLTLVR